eukprot:CAMPEP_0197846606 /NCGR_PEP_ID=MMETSP1438-20131217/3709_1 /TAXON_ID=1461541 /ORGANISM="Pterosperma sp., Strain CCMP1384" /LENGTH=1491 /DNA_ID=CAMNT_0043458311 /DNA_START=60 /DNA_END=4535 /DNA_ORIENTATION=-
MRKPTDSSPEANLQAIQTSVAFKHIADAIEQYRRQFGLAFLALIAFSAIHVGLVVIANLYTLETKVHGGVLTAAQSSADSTPVPVATGEAVRTYDLAYIMSNLDGVAQKKALSTVKNVNFVDATGKYRQYTVTGFELGGYMNSELKLYTAMGHTLAYVRGVGLSVSHQTASCNNTCAPAPAKKNTRKLLTTSASSIIMQEAVEAGAYISAEAACADTEVVNFLNFANSQAWNGEAYDFSMWSWIIRHYTTTIAQCFWNPSGGASNYQQYDVRQRDNSVAAAQTYLQHLDDTIGFEYWAEVNGATCEEGIVSSLDSSCSMYGISPFVDDNTAHSWTAQDVADAMGAGEGSYSACIDSFRHANADYLMDLSTAGELAQHVDQMFDDGTGHVEDVVDILLGHTTNAGSQGTFGDILAAFGLHQLEIDGNEVGIANVILVNPQGLSTAQQTAVDNAIALAETIGDELNMLVDNVVQECNERNTKLGKLAMAPVIQGTIDFMNSQDYLNLLEELHTVGAEIQAEHDDTQLDNCASAGVRWWQCSNFYDMYIECMANQVQSVGYSGCYDMYYRQTWTVLGAAGNSNAYAGAATSAYGAQESWECSTSLEATMIADGCTLQSLANQNYEQAAEAWAKAIEESDDNEIINLAINNELIELMDGSLDTQEIILEHVNYFLQVTTAWAIDEVTAAFDEFKDSNNWDQGKEAPMNHLSDSHTMGNAYYYGCSLQTTSDLEEASTTLSIHAYDSCDYGLDHQHRTPFFSGTYFSRIVGGFDNFAIYLPPSYCSAYLAAVAIDDMFVLNPNFDSPAYNTRKLQGSFTAAADYVIMLHGWGGSSSFLASSSYVMDFAFRGHATETGVSAEFDACLHPGDTGCSNLAYPGGFFVLAPDGSGCPLANRMWWTNSEFSGFLMDYVVFDLPSYMTFKLGLDARSVGVFGFSMGAYGSLAIVTTYIQNVAAIYAANAPMYPNDCFFTYTCHHICITDLIYCELLFTSFGQILNSYVILWSDSFVVSSGSTDPMGTGIANHMAENTNYVTCQYFDKDVWIPPSISAPKGGGGGKGGGKGRKLQQAVTMGHLGDAQGDWVSTSNLAGQVNPGGCTWQDWTAITGDCIDIPYSIKNPKGPAFSSVHASMELIDTTNGNFECAGSCDTLSLIKAAVWSYDGDSTCFAAACSSAQWCLETNDAEGASNYLDPVASLVGSMKFVPFSNVVSDTMVQSAFGHFYNSMPMTKFAAGGDVAGTVFATYPVLMYIHCAQNDEMNLYPFHVQYVAMIIGAMTKGGEFFNLDSQFVADFDDCDMHFFTEHDMKVVIAWFSDALHTFVGDTGIEGSEEANMFSIAYVTQQAAGPTGVALCWLPMTGALNVNNGAVISTPSSDGKSWLHQEACNVYDMLPAGTSVLSSWADMFTHNEWHDIESQNEQQMDTESSIALYEASSGASGVICGTHPAAVLLETSGATHLVRQGLIADPSASNGNTMAAIVPEDCTWLEGMEPEMFRK